MMDLNTYMKHFYNLVLILIFTGSASTYLAAETDNQLQTTQTRTSSEGIYKVTISSQLNPLQLGQIHSWTAKILTADDVPVTNANIIISGGMPIHNHGFPTQPMMTKILDDNTYLLEGFKFSMGGPWVIVLDITADSVTDTVAFDINM